MFAFLGNDWQPDALLGRPVLEMNIIVLPDSGSRGLHLLPGFQLGVENRRQNVGRQIAGSDIHPRVLIDLAPEETAAIGPFLPDDLSTIDIARVVNHQRSALPTSEVLRLVKAERAHRPE